MHSIKVITLLWLCLAAKTSLAQNDSSGVDRVISFPSKLFGALDKKATAIEKRLDRQTIKYLSKLERQENKLRKKLYKKDSSVAKQLFAGTEAEYTKLKNISSVISTRANAYSGHLDSLSTTLNFLKDKNIEGLSSNPELQKTLAKYKELQGKLDASEQIKTFLLKRQELLKQQFQSLGMVKELKKFREQVYYYQAQVSEYKQAFDNPEKLEEKLLQLAQSLPQFKDFFAKNSMLGSLFALPGSSAGGGAAPSMVGLQTRAMLNQSLIDRFGSGPNVMQQLQQNVQSGQDQLSQLKNKVSSYTSGSTGNSSADASMPDFKPNSQKTKSFFQRLVVGTNMQSQKSRSYFPATTDLGLSLGYKINQNSILGIGASYKLGLGTGWSNIRLSHEGVGLRSFTEYKLKGSLFLSGGYEQNYRSEFSSIAQLRNYSSWQKSGLVGLSKQYKVSKKLKGNMQLLWDFLSYQQRPQAQPIVFRIGYSFK